MKYIEEYIDHLNTYFYSKHFRAIRTVERFYVGSNVPRDVRYFKYKLNWYRKKW